jgi:flavin-dependent dehydrogenase
MYDVIVVGARVAGSPTAMLLARAGYRVLLIDRARELREVLSTHYVHQPGIARLARWGLLPAVVATGCPPVERALHDVEGIVIDGCPVPTDGQPAAYAPRRRHLDRILLAAAEAAGVEFRAGSSFRSVVLRNGRVVGLRSRGPDGRIVEDRARLVIGADGMRSAVAAAVGARAEVSDPAGTCTYFSYWRPLVTDFEFYQRPGQVVGALPTNDGATLVAAYFPHQDFDRVRADAAGAYREAIRRTAPGLAARMDDALQVEKLYGTAEQRNFFRAAAGPGWALVGDAAHHKDSITARGISDAFTQAELLTTAVIGRLDDDTALDQALRAYRTDLRADLAESYSSTLSVARLSTTPAQRTLLRLIAGSAELTARYLAVAAGGLRLADLYTEDLLQAL